MVSKGKTPGGNPPRGGNHQTPPIYRGVLPSAIAPGAPARETRTTGRVGVNNLPPPVRLVFPAVFPVIPLEQQFPQTPFWQQSAPLNNQHATRAPLPSGTSQNNGDLPAPCQLFMDI